MIVELTPHHPARVTDADRLDRLHATSADPKLVHYDELCQPGADADHVWLDIALLRQAGLDQVDDPEYGARFDAMIEYARSQGWLNVTGTRVRAHVER